MSEESSNGLSSLIESVRKLTEELVELERTLMDFAEQERLENSDPAEKD